MLKAKKQLRRLKAKQDKHEEKKKKQIAKKFQKGGKCVEKDIENYIESLFHRELQQQKQIKQIVS